MNRYTIYCNESQTKKAIELGAPIQEVHTVNNYGITTAWKRINPTAEQMFGWLEEQGLNINIAHNPFDEVKIIVIKCSSYTEIVNTKWNKSRINATLEAIDMALEYLMKSKCFCNLNHG